jgi:hypothetical protein
MGQCLFPNTPSLQYAITPCFYQYAMFLNKKENNSGIE